MAEMHNILDKIVVLPPGRVFSVTHESLKELEKNSALGTLGYTGAFVDCHSCSHTEFNIFGVPYRFPFKCPQCGAIDMWMQEGQWDSEREDNNEQG